MAEILTRDLSSGKVHRRVAIETDGHISGYASLEADNLDDAGDFEVITAEQLAEVERDALCERCFAVQDFPERTVWFRGEDE